MRRLTLAVYLSLILLFVGSNALKSGSTPTAKVVYVKQGTDVEALINAFIMVESGGDDRAVGTKDDIGCLQITPIYLAEVNRLLGYEKYRLEDRYSRVKSIEMFMVMQEHHNKEFDLHLACKLHNPLAGVGYHRRVEGFYKELARERFVITNN